MNHNSIHYILSIFYSTWFLFITFLFRSETNIAYGYAIAWCTSLWISSLFYIKIQSMIITFFIFLAVFLIDGFFKLYIFVTPKQFEGFIIVFFTLVCCLPILINFFVQNCTIKIYKFNH